MADEPAPSATLLLTYAIDDITECVQLIRYDSASHTKQRPWWRRALGAFGFLRSRDESVAEHRLLYLNDNVERAGDRWRDVLATVQRMDEPGSPDELRQLTRELRDGGIDDIAADLHRSRLPYEISAAIAHLDAIADRLVSYKAGMLKARNQRALQNMRNEGA
jgi:hypothetical protein